MGFLSNIFKPKIRKSFTTYGKLLEEVQYKIVCPAKVRLKTNKFNKKIKIIFKK